MKLNKLLILFVFIALLLSACSGDGEEGHPIDEEEGDKAGEEQGEDLSYIAPLTGEGTSEQLERRPIGVTINNHPAARPQSGLIDADLVYEVLAEGEMTRFVALFHSQVPDRVGPVRSARPYLIDLVKGYNGMLVTHGWSPDAEEMLKSGYADYLNGLFYDGTLFKRSSDRKAPHNSYITYDHMMEGLEARGYSVNGETPALTFSENLSEGESASVIDINYLDRNKVEYRYNEDSERYQRYNEGTQLVDYETNEPVQIANIFVVEADHRTLDDVGRRAIDLESGGKALLFQQGKKHDVQWENHSGQLIPVLDGKAVPFTPGSTWINILPASPGIETSVEYLSEEEVNGNAN